MGQLAKFCDAPTPVIFGIIQGLVGAFQQIIDGAGVQRVAGNAAAECDADLVAFD